MLTRAAFFREFEKKFFWGIGVQERAGATICISGVRMSAPRPPGLKPVRWPQPVA
jgi:hypothetical protein